MKKQILLNQLELFVMSIYLCICSSVHCSSAAFNQMVVWYGVKATPWQHYGSSSVSGRFVRGNTNFNPLWSCTRHCFRTFCLSSYEPQYNPQYSLDNGDFIAKFMGPWKLQEKSLFHPTTHFSTYTPAMPNETDDDRAERKWDIMLSYPHLQHPKRVMERVGETKG